MLTPLTEKLLKQLKKARLPLEDRTALTSALLERLHALPLSDTFVVGGSKLVINGKELDVEQTIAFRDSCIALKDNAARQILRNQIRYLAVNHGMYKSVSLEDLFFGKAALWCIDQEEKLLDKIV